MIEWCFSCFNCEVFHFIGFHPVVSNLEKKLEPVIFGSEMQHLQVSTFAQGSWWIKIPVRIKYKSCSETLNSTWSKFCFLPLSSGALISKTRMLAPALNMGWKEKCLFILLRNEALFSVQLMLKALQVPY